MKEEENKALLLRKLPGTQKRGWPWDEESLPPMAAPETENLPVITIVTPTLNQGGFIEETLRSVLLQNYPRLEYIILDGGSTDNTLEIIRKYRPWISHWESKKDSGQAAAIQEGFGRSTGTFLSWLNSDDLLCKNALWNLAGFLIEQEEVDFIFGYAFFYENGNLLRFETKRENIALRALGSFPFVQPACFFSASCLEKAGSIDAGLDITFDYDLFARMALSGATMQFIPADLAIFRRQPDAKTHRYNHAWDKDRTETFSRVLRSIEVEESMLKLLMSIGAYKNGKKRYPTSRIYNEKEKHSVIADFIHDNLYLYYADMRNFERTFKNARFLKRHLSEHFTKVARKYFYRSFIFKHFPPLHKLWRNFSRGLSRTS